MSNILILFASSTGNTEEMAEAMADYFEDNNHKVEIKTFDFDPIEVEEMLDYGGILIGTHTGDDGDLPYEVDEFYGDLEDIDITGKPIGVFGSADSFYDTYGGAVDLIAERVKKLGAELLPEQLKVDLDPDKEDIGQCHEFAKVFSAFVEEKAKNVSV